METAPARARITDANPSVAEMEARVARFDNLVPTDDYVDAGIPGCERTTWRVLGMPGAAPLAAADFHMNLVRCEPGKAAPLHNHLTQEVFVALSGRWQVFWGPEGERSLVLERWDTVSIPPGLSRGFRNIGDELGRLVDGDVRPRIVISFRHVEHLSSSALGTLLNINNKVRAKEGQLRLCDIRPEIAQIFEITKLNRILKIEKDVTTARASLESAKA